jgi:hypothetical protein
MMEVAPACPVLEGDCGSVMEGKGRAQLDRHLAVVDPGDLMSVGPNDEQVCVCHSRILPDPGGGLQPWRVARKRYARGWALR